MGVEILTGAILTVISISIGRLFKRIDETKKAQEVMREENEKEQTSLKNGVQALLRDRIIQSYSHYEEKGFCPIYARENLEKMHKEYKNLGGNGMIEDLMNKITDMPTN